jgi:hypothetical protein
MNNYIEFKKRRELGEILSDTFTFTRQNFKSLFNVLLKTCGIYFLIFLVLNAYYQYSSLGITPDQIGSTFFISILLFLVSVLLYYGASASATFNFIKLYNQNKGIINEEEVIQSSKRHISSLILLGFFGYFLIVFGFVLFIIPGFYLLVPIAISFPFLVFNDAGKRESIKKSMTLISGNWWVTFGTIFVTSLILGIISLTFQIPSYIYLGIKTFLSATDGTTTNDFIFVILTTLGSAASAILGILLYVALGFIYFDLDEEKNKTGLKAKIEELG